MPNNGTVEDGTGKMEEKCTINNYCRKFYFKSTQFPGSFTLLMKRKINLYSDTGKRAKRDERTWTTYISISTAGTKYRS